MSRKRKTPQPDPATKHFREALHVIARHPLFAPLYHHANVIRWEDNLCPVDGWAIVTSFGQVHAHPTRRGEPEEWVYVLAHCLLHLGFGHLQERPHHREWNAACDRVVAKFLADLKLGRPPAGVEHPPVWPALDEERLYQTFVADGVPRESQALGVAGPTTDLLFEPAGRLDRWRRPVDWPALLAEGLAAAVGSAVNVAGGHETALGTGERTGSAAERARSWFITSYPLLGSLAAGFRIVEDAEVCQRLTVSVAAVCAATQEIYMNPAAGLDEHESRFVMAHELLHVGLRHHARCQGRDPYLWNVACDYVINGWLVEMGVGDLPTVGVLYDPALKGESAEAVYDRIVTDLRRYRKLATLRGVGLGDMLAGGTPDWWTLRDGADLDDFYRRCLSQGLVYHEEQNRGLLPAGLVEEIRALSQPPIPWDVALAAWFDAHFSPLERRRTYARPSRRQSATPHIPRPRWVPAAGAEDGRTFGVVLDTSGSMDRPLLAKALGAIAGYAIARDVPAVRVVFCDASTYDQGYLPPEAIADRVKVKGRGGTVLQPAVDLLESAEDFPPDGPLLVITDGMCDRLRIRREHAFLLPEGRSLPFPVSPRGKLFRIR